MIDKETCGAIFEKYHKTVYNFCFKYLKNPIAAEDCTKEVFYTLLKKKNKIDLTDNLLSWLLSASRRICKKYLSKNSVVMLDIDDYADELLDSSFMLDKPLSDKIYDILDKDEADLLLDYFNSSHGERKLIAEKLGISGNVLSKRIKRIREKVIKHLDE